jgi:hypothetical protein
LDLGFAAETAREATMGDPQEAESGERSGVVFVSSKFKSPTNPFANKTVIRHTIRKSPRDSPLPVVSEAPPLPKTSAPKSSFGVQPNTNGTAAFDARLGIVVAATVTVVPFDTIGLLCELPNAKDPNGGGYRRRLQSIIKWNVGRL